VFGVGWCCRDGTSDQRRKLWSILQNSILEEINPHMYIYIALYIGKLCENFALHPEPKEPSPLKYSPKNNYYCRSGE
jgi:hypothetical protein